MKNNYITPCALLASPYEIVVKRVKNQNRYARAREAGVRSIGCSERLLATVQAIAAMISRKFAVQYVPRNILDLVLYLMPLLVAMAKAMAKNSGFTITIEFEETGFGDAKKVNWPPDFPLDEGDYITAPNLARFQGSSKIRAASNGLAIKSGGKKNEKLSIPKENETSAPIATSASVPENANTASNVSSGEPIDGMVAETNPISAETSPDLQRKPVADCGEKTKSTCARETRNKLVAVQQDLFSNFSKEEPSVTTKPEKER